MPLSNLANAVMFPMCLFDKSTEISIISAEDSADRCVSVPFINVTVMLQIMLLRLLSHVFHFSNHRPPYYSKLQPTIPTILETPLNDK